MTTATLDVRRIAPRERHPLIFATSRGLAKGQAILNPRFTST